MSTTEWSGADTVRTRRIERGMTQAQVAKAAGVLLRQYQRYEKGEREPSLSTARAIAEALDLPLSELAGQIEPGAPTAAGTPSTAVAETIQTRRRQIGLTQLAAATAAGLPLEHYQRLEAGSEELSLAAATAIATALDMPLPVLAGIIPRPVDLNGQWWTSWQGALDQTDTIDTHQVTVIHAGNRLLLDSGWRGELQISDNEVLIGWYRPAQTMTRTRAGVFLWLPAYENYLYGRWTGVSANNTVVSGWCALAREEGRATELIDTLVRDKTQPRPALRLPGLSNWG
ncbi:helix-turn-helix domain-containing protein [Mycobacterium avium]|uniref:helix-turn-helix domain-containing protein n=1 Tax=Mycobacterium avium TaxID=1764 RepID=UPI001F341770|nr:helix-turn-helix transcriptional regulator [Mycobacterium avium]